MSRDDANINICKVIQYQEQGVNNLAVIIDVANDDNICCFLKKFADRKWKVKTVSSLTCFVINLAPLDVKMTPFFRDVELTAQQIRLMTDKMLRKIIWVDQSSIPIKHLKGTSDPLILDIKSKDMRGKYDLETKEYNEKYANSVKNLGVNPLDIKALVLDTAMAHTCSALIKLGVSPLNIIVANNSKKEYEELKKTSLCCAFYGDFCDCLTRYIKNGIKFNTIFLDNGGWINIEPIVEGEKRKSQDMIIRYIFDQNSLTDECVFALITAKRRHTNGDHCEYAKSAYEFIKKYADDKGYRLVNFVQMPYGKRTFYQSYHLIRK
jgi:hypothetical protein